MKKISITIPCYKSENTIEKLCYEIKKEMNEHKNYLYEIILVNDGSPDKTFSVISKLAKNDVHIKAYNLSKNFGQDAAQLAAYSKATGDYIVRMDDDGEHNPEDLFSLINKLEEGYDYVCAEFKHYHHTLYKRIGSKFNYWFLAKMMDVPNGAIMSSYNVTKKYVIDELIKYPNPKPYVDGMIWAITNNVASVPIEHSFRYAGESGYDLKKSIECWLNGATSYSVKPLRLASLCGLLFSIIGFISIIIVVIHKIAHPEDVTGWASLIATMLFIGGFIMIFLGLIGEYIGRGYLVNNRIPQYVIKEEVVCKKDNIKRSRSIR